MPLAILKVAGGLIGIFAAWFISKKISIFMTSFLREWNKKKEEQFKLDQQERYQKLKDQNEVYKKKIDDFLEGP